MRDLDPPQGFRQAERLSGTLGMFRQCGGWSRQGYRERRFAELKLTFVGGGAKARTRPHADGRGALKRSLKPIEAAVRIATARMSRPGSVEVIEAVSLPAWWHVARGAVLVATLGALHGKQSGQDRFKVGPPHDLGAFVSGDSRSHVVDLVIAWRSRMSLQIAIGEI